MMGEHDEISAFAYQVGHLSRSPRSGWLLAGVRDPESVAEHSHRAAVLAYIIATMEGADPHRACTLAVFHDLPETRTTDLHSVAKRERPSAGREGPDGGVASGTQCRDSRCHR